VPYAPLGVKGLDDDDDDDDDHDDTLISTAQFDVILNWQ